MTQTKLCPCGSGKSQELCCGNNARAGGNIRQIVIWAGILAIVGVMTALGISSQQKSAEEAAETATVVSTAPKPWEYNPITNEHYDPRPGHEHMHAGPPPADQVTTGLPGQPTLPNVNTSTTRLTPDATAQPTPEPWQYDQASNKHYNPTPGHEHWHDGPPPDGFDQGASVPQPWEYNAVTDKHWHPEHAHWHDGPGPGGYLPDGG